MVRLPRADDHLRVPTEHLHTLHAGTRLYRVHDSKYKEQDGRVRFNASGQGNARFSPLRQGEQVVPTLYAGLTFDCALMETVFHDISPRIGVTMHPDKLKGLVATEIDVATEMRLVDLTSVGLRRFGLQNTDLIDTLPSYYKVTQAWANALYSANPSAHGLYWTSRLDNRSQAMMFFGDRLVGNDALKPVGRARELHRLSGGPIIEVLQLAETIGVDISR